LNSSPKTIFTGLWWTSIGIESSLVEIIFSIGFHLF
jgi:hypothetical protein